MARANISQPAIDLVTDSGSVLFSLVQGEQLELPMKLTFLRDVTLGYTFEAVIIEGGDVPARKQYPSIHRPSGVETTLIVRLPIFRGVWDEATEYTTEDVVYFSGKYWKLYFGEDRVFPFPPGVDTEWLETTLQTVYVQFPETVASTWQVQPTASKPTYGFFELQVNEPSGTFFPRVWKPFRGLVEISFSPTYLVA